MRPSRPRHAVALLAPLALLTTSVTDFAAGPVAPQSGVVVRTTTLKPVVRAMPPAPKATITLPSGVSVSVALPPGGSPAPITAQAPVFTSFPQKSSLRCNAQKCTSPEMPFYNQGNPNFAYIQVPASTYSAEVSPITGSLVDDNGTEAVKIPPLDPFYDSWLPYGPLPTDGGSIGIWFTAICAPTAESMALATAIAQKSPTTVLKGGSWTDVSFVAAQRPSWQAAIAAPLAYDHTTRVPSAQMTATDIQRIVNMALLQKTDPTGGGLANAFQQAANDFGYAPKPVVGGPPPPPHQVAWTRDGTTLDDGTFVNLLRQGFVIVVAIHEWKASVDASNVTFTRIPFGHVLALNGFEMQGSRPQFLIYDPVYANSLWWTFGYVKAGMQQVSLGRVRNVITPTGGDLATVAYTMASGFGVGSHTTSDIVDGSILIAVDEWHALRLE